MPCKCFCLYPKTKEQIFRSFKKAGCNMEITQERMKSQCEETSLEAIAVIQTQDDTCRKKDRSNSGNRNKCKS